MKPEKRKKRRGKVNLGLDVNKVVDPKSDPNYTEPTGPNFHFGVLLGESATWGRDGHTGLWAWTGEAWTCGACCRHETLPGSHYCIHCDRSGRDAEIPKPTEQDLARRRERRVYAPPDGLVGGVGAPLAGRVKRQAG